MPRYSFLFCVCQVVPIQDNIMGYKLLILLGLLAGVLYSLHLLVQDYQALTAAPKLLRFLFKRDTNSQSGHSRPNVRWKRILFYDQIECARFFYCDLGARPANNEVRQGFRLLLALEPREEEKSSHEVFKMAYQYGQSSVSPDECRKLYPICPFNALTLFELVQFLIRHSVGVRQEIVLDKSSLYMESSN